MAAGEYDIFAEQGTTYTLSLTYKDSTDSAIDLDSYSGRMQVRRSINDTQAVLFLTGVTGHAGTEPGSLTGGGSTGEFTTGTTQGQTGTGGIMLNTSSAGAYNSTGGIYISIDSTTMANVPAGNHVYDLELVAGSTVDRILKGRFEVNAEVTR